jgi:two-component system, NarL family, response regulator NreC
MPPNLDDLTPREQEVLRLLALGHTNREVAELLHVSVRTAEFHRASIQRKLGVSTRSALVRFAIANGPLARERRASADGSPSKPDGSPQDAA